MEIEPVWVPSVMHRIDRVCWDALGQVLLIEGRLAQSDTGEPKQIQVVLTETAAGELLLALQARFEEKDSAAGPVQ